MLDALRRRLSGIATILSEPQARSTAEPGDRRGPRLVDRSPSFVFCLDHPTAVPSYERFVVQAWLASARPIGEVRLAGEGHLDKVPRADVEAVHGAQFAHVQGLRGWLPASSLRDGAWLDFELDLGGERQLCSIELSAGETARPDPAAKARKLARVRALLRSDLPHTETKEHFDFLAPDLRQHAIVDTGNIPSAAYDDVALAIVREVGSGLILDAGAGLRREAYENVVNLEIVPYHSTDVLSGIDDLPFKDESFDAVFSFAVLEHVKDPFRCARELYRVLKPGGKLYVNVPFLQPYHGYPHHYYNMTAQGLANLFPPDLEVVASDVPHYGLPIWTLSWLLNSWAQALPAPTRERFLEMRLRDLVGDPHQYLDQDFVRQLPDEANFELASVTALLGRKRGG